METPMLPATGFLTSYQPQFHQKSRCSTAKFQVLPKVQWLSHHFKFQVPSKGSGTSKFQVLPISGTSLLDHGEVQCSFLQKSGCQKMMEAPHIHW